MKKIEVTIFIKPEYLAKANKQPKPINFQAIELFIEEIMFVSADSMDDVVELCHCFAENAWQHIFIDKKAKSIEIPIKYFTFKAFGA